MDNLFAGIPTCEAHHMSVMDEDCEYCIAEAVALQALYTEIVTENQVIERRVNAYGVAADHVGILTMRIDLLIHAIMASQPKTHGRFEVSFAANVGEALLKLDKEVTRARLTGNLPQVHG